MPGLKPTPILPANPIEGHCVGDEIKNKGPETLSGGI